MKSLFPRIADVVTALVVLVLGGGMVWGGSYLLWSEYQATRRPIETAAVIVAILVVLALLSGYTAYRFIERAIHPTK